jgi:hypothetical protein
VVWASVAIVRRNTWKFSLGSPSFFASGSESFAEGSPLPWRKPSFSAAACNWFIIRVRVCTMRWRCQIVEIWRVLDERDRLRSALEIQERINHT